MRLGSFQIPDKERLEVALTRIYGIGPSRAKKVIKISNLDANKRAAQLTPEEISRLLAGVRSYKTEGDLRAEIRGDIERLKAIRSYRGIRHIVNLPVRGQRTRVNARTKRGKKKTVGALTKEMWAKIEAQQKEALEKKS
ncbi:MAG: 30S ribosomal protein S13 [Candidatus Shapirobacteria bacterium]